MTVCLAYACVVAHVSLGALQDARDPMLALLVFGSVLALCALHVAAAARGVAPAPSLGAENWIVAGGVADLEDGHGTVVDVPGAEAVAVFRDGDAISAVSNLCAHQNGPLGEGRVIDGCITCPWHGFQYRLADGCAPPPFTEKLATYRLRLDGGTILLDPRPNPPGTYVAPLRIAGAA
jgi:nitrite reductase/ring-hydroxylating ferredoxin subunit